MAGPSVVAFLSAGRCGTQWLANALRELYPDVDVEHEPIGAQYRSRRYFRRYADPQAILDVPEVAAHAERIERSRRPYIETGWPQFAALPLLAARLPKRLRIVHLTRHPVPSALSHLAHRRAGHRRGTEADAPDATLTPTDPGVFQPYYSDSWERLTPYEKCLFLWTEVQLYGLELPGRIGRIPFLRIRAERLLAGDRRALVRLLRFLELPWSDGWEAHHRRVADRWQDYAEHGVDPLELHRHPTTVEVAAQLGYDVSGLNLGALERHYRPDLEPDPEPTRR
jgi:hypothetical protein